MDTLYKAVTATLDEDLLSSIDRDLKQCSDELERAGGDKEKIEDILAKYILLRNRIKSSSGVKTAQIFDKYITQL